MNAPTHRPDWLRHVPEEWPVALLRLLTRVESGHTPSRSHPEYWVPEDCIHPWFTLADIWQLRDGRQKYIEETKERISDVGLAHSAARLLPAGTVALSRTASVGFSGIFSKPMATTQDFVNFVCGPRLVPDFLLWVLRGMKPEFDRLMRGSTHQTIYMPDLMQFRVPVPRHELQRAIADFLDEKTAAIDTLIEKKERLTELLAEKRAALIHQAVTKGLDPTVPMKPSGIPWIGDIPAHWNLAELRRFWDVVDCKHRTPEYVDDGYPVVSTTEVKPGRIDLGATTRFIDAADFEDMTGGGRRPKRGDIIYSRNASLGAAAFVDTDAPFAMGQDVVLISSGGEDQLFLAQQLNSSVGMTQVSLACVGATFKRINVAQIRQIVVCVPPKPEQASIAEHVDRVDREHQQLSSLVADQLRKLADYRQALITAAVTGQLDIPGAAA